MPLSRRGVLVLGCGSLLGCAAPADFLDGGTIAADRALVLVHLRYTYGRLRIDECEIGLTRLAPGAPPENLLLSLVPNKDIAILEVPPGNYFLRGLRARDGYVRHTFEPRLTLFSARPGQINYPGDWVIDVRVLSSTVSGTVARGSVSAKYEIRVVTVKNDRVAALLAAKYPILNSKLPLRITRLTDD